MACDFACNKSDCFREAMISLPLVPWCFTLLCLFCYDTFHVLLPPRWNDSSFVWGLWMQPASACGRSNVLRAAGREKLKLSYWIDWAFMKPKWAPTPTSSSSSRVVMISRHLRGPVRSTALRIPTLQSGAAVSYPAGTIHLFNPSSGEQEGSFCHTHTADFIKISVPLFTDSLI